MPRKGNGDRTRRTMASHAQTRALNTELREAREHFAPQRVAERASKRVSRITRVEIPAHAVFSAMRVPLVNGGSRATPKTSHDRVHPRISSGTVISAMGIRPVNGESSRGQWLADRAASFEVATDRRTPEQRRHDAHTARNKRDVRSVGSLARSAGSAIRRIERDRELMCTALAQWSVWDEAYFATLFGLIAEHFDLSEDQKQLSEDLRVLALMREASRLWEDDMIAKIYAGGLDADRLRDEIDARKAQAARIDRRRSTYNGATGATADYPLWDTQGVTVKPRPARTVKLTPAFSESDAAHAALALSSTSHGPDKFNSRGTD